VKKQTTEHLFLRFRRRGDASALGEVFDRTAEDLFKLALYLAPEATDAEDLVQATYLTAIEAAHNFESGRRLLPWLLGILSNHARKARDQFRRRTGIDGDRLTVPSSDIGLKDNPEINAEHAELHATLGKAISRLPQPYRQVLVLRPCARRRATGRAPYRGEFGADRHKLILDCDTYGRRRCRGLDRRVALRGVGSRAQ
jgi:RNA polymerase sigma factor (sigma-70 family)